MKFSVLISIYYKEKAEYFNIAMQSIWKEQIRKPDEIILVEDGVLTDELYEAIDIWKEELKDKLNIISLKENKGLGEALNIGMKHCTYNIVARMDTDDIATPDRFEKQISFLKENPNIDILGSWVSEFETDENNIISCRKLPESHNEIIDFSKKRNPINHPSVMYKKRTVEKAGGYKKMILFEDYYLWSRMILVGATFYNIQEPLVNMRAGYGQLKRRSGLKYAMNEITFQKELLNIDFINIYEFFRNISIRFTARVVPKSIVQLIYKRLRS